MAVALLGNFSIENRNLHLIINCSKERESLWGADPDGCLMCCVVLSIVLGQYIGQGLPTGCQIIGAAHLRAEQTSTAQSLYGSP